MCLSPMFNDLLCIELVTLIILFFLNQHQSLLMTWYLGGLYLILIGLLALIANGDIFIGFLWVIDLGVGLIFLIFILHFTSFLNSKTYTVFNERNVIILLPLIIFITILSLSPLPHSNSKLYDSPCVSFLISWYDYYEILLIPLITDLNLLKELYFLNNSFEFFVINFLLFFGICLAILLTFLIRKQINILSMDQLKNKPFIKQINATFFIRNQNLITQQNTSTGLRLWKKNSHFRI